MKDEHNVILILVSSSKFNSLFRRLIKFSVSIVSSFLPRSSNLSQLYHHEDSSNHYKASILFASNLQLFYVIISYPDFFMEAQHDGTSRISFILHWFFKISLEVMIRQAILSNKHGAQHMSCFEEFKHSSSCILKCNSFYLIFWDGVMPFLTISRHVSWFASCQVGDN